MTTTLTITLTIAVIYAIFVSKLYASQHHLTTKFMREKERYAHECYQTQNEKAVLEREISKLRDSIGELQSDLRIAKNLYTTWRERAKRWQSTANIYKNKFNNTKKQ